VADNGEVPNYEKSAGSGRRGPLRGTKLVEIAIPTCLVLVISIPVMIVEEDWHGRPMIDQGTHLWILPAILVAAAFLFGGALAGFRCPSSAVAHAVVAGTVALAVLVLGAMYRRLWFAHESVPHPVIRLWCLAIVGAFILSVIGSLFGRRLGAERF
jgi:hypothetical protein